MLRQLTANRLLRLERRHLDNPGGGAGIGRDRRGGVLTARAGDRPVFGNIVVGGYDPGSKTCSRPSDCAAGRAGAEDQLGRQRGRGRAAVGETSTSL